MRRRQVNLLEGAPINMERLCKISGEGKECLDGWPHAGALIAERGLQNAVHGKSRVRANVSPATCNVVDGLTERALPRQLNAKKCRTEQISDHTLRHRRITQRERRSNDKVISGGVRAQQRRVGGQINMEWR